MRELVEKYLQFFASREADVAQLRPLLSEKLQVKSPLGDFQGRDNFLQDLKRNALSIRSLKITQIIVDGDKACALYNVMSNDPEIGELMFSEWFETSDGKISRIISTYDASEVRRVFAQI